MLRKCALHFVTWFWVWKNSYPDCDCRDKRLNSCGATLLDIMIIPTRAYQHMRIFDNEGFTPTHILYVPFVLRSPFSHCTTYRHHTIGDSLKWDTEVTYSPSSVLSELYHYFFWCQYKIYILFTIYL